MLFYLKYLFDFSSLRVRFFSHIYERQYPIIKEQYMVILDMYTSPRCCYFPVWNFHYKTNIIAVTLVSLSLLNKYIFIRRHQCTSLNYGRTEKKT